MQTTLRWLLWGMVAAATGLAGCGGDDDSSNSGGGGEAAKESDEKRSK